MDKPAPRQTSERSTQIVSDVSLGTYYLVSRDTFASC